VRLTEKLFAETNKKAWEIEWSRDRRRHKNYVIPKCQTRDPNSRPTLRAQYLDRKQLEILFSNNSL